MIHSQRTLKALILGLLTLGLLLMAGTSPGAAQQSVELRSSALTESSGLAVSTLDPQVVWTHNDSGDRARLFAFTRQGEPLAELELWGAKAIDWEDMCSFLRDGKSYLAIGDVGDNARRRASVTIYICEEPKLALPGPLPQRLVAKDFQRIVFEYPGGAVDCESLAYDPLGEQFWLASKEMFRCRLFSLPLSSATQQPRAVAEFKQMLFLPLTTGADISRDGQKMVIATYGPACMLQRDKDGTWDMGEAGLEMLEMPPRKQGESICFGEDGASLLLTSEFAPTPLWTVPYKKR